MWQFKSSLRGPLRQLMEKNEELKRAAEAKDKEMASLIAAMEQERAGMNRVVEAAMQPYKMQVEDHHIVAFMLPRVHVGCYPLSLTNLC